MFGTGLLVACTLMTVYVFWRTATVPWIARHIPRMVWALTGLALWLLFVAGRYAEAWAGAGPARWLELGGMDWLASVFLLTICVLTVDLATLFGRCGRRFAPVLRGWALLAGVLLSILAMVQGVRPPVVTEFEVRLAGLPPELDGTVLVAMSDLHIGTLLGEDWLAARVEQVQAERPDLVVLPGDLFEGHGRPDGDPAVALRRLAAPLGIWAVNGNHDGHGGEDGNEKLLNSAGIQILRNRSVEIRPGLILAGIDNIGRGTRLVGGRESLRRTLASRPPGAVILLSHSPLLAEEAARGGAGLMLCGHTHGGQIWPSGYLVQTVYPLLAGRYQVEGMPVIVCRGTGTWGPRMRLWQPGEILRIVLRSGTGTDGIRTGR